MLLGYILQMTECLILNKLFRIECVVLANSDQNPLKAGVNLNDILAPLNTGLVQISRSHFKQSINSMLKT